MISAFNNYILSEVSFLSADKTSPFLTRRPLKEVLLDPLRELLGRKNFSQAKIIGNKVFIETDSKYLESLIYRIYRIIFNLEIAIFTISTTYFLFGYDSLVENSTELLFLVTGVFYHALLKEVFSDLRVKTYIKLLNAPIITISLIFFAYLSGISVSAYVCRSVAILIGSVAIGIILKMGHFVLSSRARNAYKLYLRHLENNKDKQLTVRSNPQIWKEETIGFFNSQDILQLIVACSSNKNLFQLRRCNKSLNSFISLNALFDRWINLLPDSFKNLEINKTRLDSNTVKLIEKNLVSSRFESLPLYTDINEHLGRDKAITWGITSDDKIFLCFQMKLMSQPSIYSYTKLEKIFHYYYYGMLYQNEDIADRWYKNIQIIGNSNSRDYALGWHLINHLLEDEQRDYWQRMLSSQTCGRLVPHPVREDSQIFRISLKKF